MINRAQDEQPSVRREALEQLLRCYMPVLRAHLVRHKRLPPELADELLQAFLVKNVVEGKLVERADASAGKFRSWLLKWLDTFVRAHFSRLKFQESAEDLDWDGGQDAIDSFDADWARATLCEAVATMKSECTAEGNPCRWEIFEQRLLIPLLSRAEPTDYQILIEKLNLQSTAQAQNLLITAKRHFQRSLQSVVARYAESEDEIAVEITQLRRVLARATCGSEDFDFGTHRSLRDQDIDGMMAAAPERMAKLYELDIASIWQRCLACPIGELLSVGNGDCESAGHLTLRELHTQRDPSHEFLIRLKQFGNSLIQRESQDLPLEVGLAIYLTSIALARVRLGKSISNAPMETLRAGYKFLQENEWMDESSLAILGQAFSEN